MKKQMYELRVACLNLGTGHGRSKGKRGTRKVSNLRHSPTNMGVRAAGGGRKDHFEEFMQLVKIYTDVERLRGHHLEPDDVFREFKDQVQKRIDIFSFKRKYGELSPAEGYKISLWEDRLQKLIAPTRYKETYTNKLLKYCMLSIYGPQRFTILSSFEEKLRCQLSWMMFDRLMYLAAFGTA